MTDREYKIQKWFWTRFVKPVPTCFLQSELSKREGVEVHRVQPYEHRTFGVSGPCVVSLNHD
jgi:hypothetical protein